MKLLIFFTDFLKRLKYQMSSNTVHWEPSCSTWEEGPMDRHNEAVTFHNFANMLTNNTQMLPQNTGKFLSDNTSGGNCHRF
jgi:arylamine N-acetyltransferase